MPLRLIILNTQRYYDFKEEAEKDREGCNAPWFVVSPVEYDKIRNMYYFTIYEAIAGDKNDTTS